MGADLPEAIHHFGDSIHYVHFRDVEEDAEDVTEIWHDAGPTDMLGVMRAFHEVGFEGPMRPASPRCRVRRTSAPATR